MAAGSVPQQLLCLHWRCILALLKGQQAGSAAACGPPPLPFLTLAQPSQQAGSAAAACGPPPPPLAYPYPTLSCHCHCPATAVAASGAACQGARPGAVGRLQGGQPRVVLPGLGWWDTMPNRRHTAAAGGSRRLHPMHPPTHPPPAPPHPDAPYPTHVSRTWHTTASRACRPSQKRQASWLSWPPCTCT